MSRSPIFPRTSALTQRFASRFLLPPVTTQTYSADRSEREFTALPGVVQRKIAQGGPKCTATCLSVKGVHRGGFPGQRKIAQAKGGV
jgi:hypothetical protein